MPIILITKETGISCRPDIFRYSTNGEYERLLEVQSNIFVPSIKILDSRLVGRRTDTADIVNEQLNNATNKYRRQYGHNFITDQL